MTAGSKAQVLVIDDSPDVRTFLALWLSGLGCDVRTVADGEAAERELAKEKPDVILLDVVLPGVNGFEICERLKQQTSTRQIPVVMMSGLRQAANVRRAREVGAQHYLLKPFDESELMAVIGSVVADCRAIRTQAADSQASR